MSNGQSTNDLVNQYTENINQTLADKKTSTSGFFFDATYEVTQAPSDDVIIFGAVAPTPEKKPSPLALLAEKAKSLAAGVQKKWKAAKASVKTEAEAAQALEADIVLHQQETKISNLAETAKAVKIDKTKAKAAKAKATQARAAQAAQAKATQARAAQAAQAKIYEAQAKATAEASGVAKAMSALAAQAGVAFYVGTEQLITEAPKVVASPILVASKIPVPAIDVAGTPVVVTPPTAVVVSAPVVINQALIDEKKAQILAIHQKVETTLSGLKKEGQIRQYDVSAAYIGEGEFQTAVSAEANVGKELGGRINVASATKQVAVAANIYQSMQQGSDVQEATLNEKLTTLVYPNSRGLKKAGMDPKIFISDKEDPDFYTTKSRDSNKVTQALTKGSSTANKHIKNRQDQIGVSRKETRDFLDTLGQGHPAFAEGGEHENRTLSELIGKVGRGPSVSSEGMNIFNDILAHPEKSDYLAANPDFAAKLEEVRQITIRQHDKIPEGWIDREEEGHIGFVETAKVEDIEADLTLSKSGYNPFKKGEGDEEVIYKTAAARGLTMDTTGDGQTDVATSVFIMAKGELATNKEQLFEVVDDIAVQVTKAAHLQGEINALEKGLSPGQSTVEPSAAAVQTSDGAATSPSVADTVPATAIPEAEAVAAANANTKKSASGGGQVDPSPPPAVDAFLGPLHSGDPESEKFWSEVDPKGYAEAEKVATFSALEGEEVVIALTPEAHKANPTASNPLQVTVGKTTFTESGEPAVILQGTGQGGAPRSGVAPLTDIASVKKKKASTSGGGGQADPSPPPAIEYSTAPGTASEIIAGLVPMDDSATQEFKPGQWNPKRAGRTKGQIPGNLAGMTDAEIESKGQHLYTHEQRGDITDEGQYELNMLRREKARRKADEGKPSAHMTPTSPTDTPGEPATDLATGGLEQTAGALKTAPGKEHAGTPEAKAPTAAVDAAETSAAKPAAKVATPAEIEASNRKQALAGDLGTIDAQLKKGEITKDQAADMKVQARVDAGETLSEEEFAAVKERNEARLKLEKHAQQAFGGLSAAAKQRGAELLSEQKAEKAKHVALDYTGTGMPEGDESLTEFKALAATLGLAPRDDQAMDNNFLCKNCSLDGIFNTGDSATDAYANKGARIEITHIASGTKVAFKAYVNEYSDRYESKWNKQEVFGRMDPIMTFQSTSRVIRLGWVMPSYGLCEAKCNMQKVSALIKMLYPEYRTAAGSRGVGAVVSAPLLRLKFMNLATSAESVKRGLVVTSSGFDFEPDLEMGFYTPTGGFRSPQSEIFPKVLTLSTEFTVLHSHTLGWKGSRERGSFRKFPYYAKAPKKLEQSKTKSPAVATFMDDPTEDSGSRIITEGIATGETNSAGAAPRNMTNASSQRARGNLGNLAHARDVFL